MKRALLVFFFAVHSAYGQSAADGPVLGAIGIDPTAGIKVFNPAGTVRIVAWDRDSVVVRGHVATSQQFFFGGGRQGAKLGTEDRKGAKESGRSDLVIFAPRRGKLSVKTVSAGIVGDGISGWFYSVSGSIRLTGIVSSVEVETMNGSIDLDVTTPWLRARTGDGHLLIRGAPQDVDASTISGTLDVVAPKIMRAQFVSVSGDIRWVGSPAAGAVFDFSNHSGAVELMLPTTASAALTLASVSGAIDNGFTRIRPVAAEPHSLRLNLGRGDAHLSARTFKGPIRLRPE